MALLFKKVFLNKNLVNVLGDVVCWAGGRQLWFLFNNLSLFQPIDAKLSVGSLYQKAT
jgi:hypothetical protein